MRRLVVLVAALAVGGCGSEEEEERPASPSGTISVVVLPEGEGGVERARRIECPRSELCPRIARASFQPPREPVACTELYGGPAVAIVRGTIGSRRIDARFSLQDGCAINRWNDYAWLLGPPPGA